MPTERVPDDMTQPTPAKPTPPSRPSLFGPATEAAGQPAPQRISVLASLDARPAPAPKKKRRPLWLAIAALFSAGLIGSIVWELTDTPALLAQKPEPAVVAQPVPAAPPPAAAESSPAAELVAENAPASIERIEPDTPLAALEAPAAQASAPEEAPSPAPAETAAPKKSLLATLAAPAANTPESPSRKSAAPAGKGNTSKAEVATAPRKVGKKDGARESANDTDVLLLEALVAHDPKAQTPSALPDKKP
ncbi:hypothetical protein [Uliginosibacterium sp. TH139]|uniref:hypothetical protein n=1 Tax=Uliginosibacterium sp. TH139 TaxID=2067453 RepID=UPI0013045C58|nr:hypothetical protein [Uliginosibacterium sp. TH139]